MNRLKTSLRGFLRDESGLLLAETLLFLPLLIWTFIALVVYWDAFRAQNVTQKAAYSIADLMSRQDDVTPDFVNGLQNVLGFLTPGTPESRMRVTSLEYCATGDDYEVLFSMSPGGKVSTVYDNASVQALRPRIPTLADRETVIVVETWVDYSPGFDIGVLNLTESLNDQTFTQFIVTRPRDRRVCLDNCPAVCN